MAAKPIKRIAHLSVHGYFDPEPILGRTDTGGQVGYVLELAKHLAKDGIKVDSELRGRLMYISLNQKNKILANPKVVEAMKYLIDYEGMKNSFLKGQYTIHQAFLPRTYLGAISDTLATGRHAAARRPVRASRRMVSQIRLCCSPPAMTSRTRLGKSAPFSIKPLCSAIEKACGRSTSVRSSTASPGRCSFPDRNVTIRIVRPFYRRD